MKLKIIIIALMLIPITVTTVSSETDDAILITTISDYGINSKHIEEPVVYTSNVLTTGHLPLRINLDLTNNIELSKTDLNKLIDHKLIGSKEGTFEYKVLVNTTFSYQTPRVTTKEVPYQQTYIDNKTGKEVTEDKIQYKDVIVGYDNHTDYKWIWKPIKDLNELTLNKDGFIIIDIIGHFEATTEQWNIDVIPTLDIKGVKTEYKQFAWWNDGWAFSKRAYVESDNIEVPLYNFPVLIRNTSADFANARSDGYDFRFVTQDNTTEYYFELEFFNDTKNELIAWVNFTYLDDDADTVFYIYYGNPSADTDQSNEFTWNSEYAEVYHLTETSGNVDDSTINDIASTVTSGDPSYRASGVVHKAINYDSNDYHKFPDMLSNAESEIGYTIEAWANFDQDGYTRKIVSWGGHKYIILSTLSSSGWKLRHFTIDDGVAADSLIHGDAVSGGVWEYCVATYDGSYKFVYLNSDNRERSSEASIYSETQFDTIGAGWDGAWGTTGRIDEVRISKHARNYSWLNATYLSISSYEDFVIFEEQEEQPEGPGGEMIVIPYPDNTSTGVCPCCSAICVNVTNSVGNNMNLSFFCIETDYSYDMYNCSNGTYCFCMACGLYTIDYNTTYHWYVNVTRYYNSSQYNRSDVFVFTTAETAWDCYLNATGMQMADYAWTFVIGVLFSIFGLIAFIKTRRMKLK